jgi:hypothetical protein
LQAIAGAHLTYLDYHPAGSISSCSMDHPAC